MFERIVCDQFLKDLKDNSHNDILGNFQSGLKPRHGELTSSLEAYNSLTCLLIYIENGLINAAKFIDQNQSGYDTFNLIKMDRL